jgi:hypothetical protein
MGILSILAKLVKPSLIPDVISLELGHKTLESNKRETGIGKALLNLVSHGM